MNNELRAFVVPRLVKQRQRAGRGVVRCTTARRAQPVARYSHSRVRALPRSRSSSAALRCLARVPR